MRLALVGALVAALGVTAACAPTKGSGSGTRIMLVGDSSADSIGDALLYAFTASGRPFKDVSQGGCPIVQGRVLQVDGTELPWGQICENAIYRAHQENLDQFRPNVVLWFGIFESYPRSVNGTTYFHYPPNPEGDALLWALIEEKWRQFTAAGATLVFLTYPPPPVTRDALPERALYLNEIFRQFADTHAGAEIIDLSAMVCPTGVPCLQIIDGITMRPDGVHFSPEGASWVAARIASLLP